MRVVLRRVALGCAVLMLVALGYTGYQAWRSARSVTLPLTPGPYRVGRSTLEWTDHSRGDRELSVWVWYPAAASHVGTAPYLPGAWSSLHFPFPVGLAETRPSSVRTHSRVGASPASGRFPIVVLEPGLGFSAPQYSALAESLAAQGFYVAGVTPTYSANVTVLHGRVVAATSAGLPRAFDEADLHRPGVVRVADQLTGVWAADALFAADQLAADPRLGPHTDRSSTAFVGHSFGGSASLEACRLDSHCTAAVDLDGTQYGEVARRGLTKPLMIVQSGGSCVTGVCAHTDVGDVRTARQLLTASPGPHRCYTAVGAQHFSFTDYGAYHLAWPLRHLLPLGSAPGREVLQQTATQTAAFLSNQSARTSRLRALAC